MLNLTALRNGSTLPARPLATVFAFLLLVSQTAFAAADDVLGLWASNGSIIEITNHNGNLSARIIAIEDAVYQEGEDFGPVGAPRRDDLNPDEAKRTTPLLGLELLSEYRRKGKKWEGKIYDPESGKTYSSKMHVEDGVLQMRGYIGMPMFGRTATFRAASSCEEDIKLMLLAANRTLCSG